MSCKKQCVFLCLRELLTGTVICKEVCIFTEWVNYAFPSHLAYSFWECGNQLWNKSAKYLFTGLEYVQISVLLLSLDWTVCGRKQDTNLPVPERSHCHGQSTPQIRAPLGWLLFCTSFSWQIFSLLGSYPETTSPTVIVDKWERKSSSGLLNSV